MNIAVNTDYNGDEVYPELCLKNAAEAGFSFVQWCHNWNDDYIYSDSEIDQIGTWLHEYGLKFNDIHATKGQRKNYLSFKEYERLAGVELIKNRIHMASKLDAGAIVLHMIIPNQYINTPNLERLYEQAYKSFDELEPYCRERGIRIAIENMLETPYEVQVDQFKRIFNRYSPDYIGMCFDTGHAHCTFKEGRHSIEFLEMFIDRFISVHIADNDGSGDQHKMPFAGTIDWDELLKVIARSSYDRCFMMEVVMGNSGIKDEKVFLDELRKSGEKAAGIIERYREL